MRVGGLGGTSKAGPRIAPLWEHFTVENLGGMWQKKERKKKYCFIPVALRFSETIAILINTANYSGKGTIRSRLFFNVTLHKATFMALWGIYVLTSALCGYSL